MSEVQALIGSIGPYQAQFLTKRRLKLKNRLLIKVQHS